VHRWLPGDGASLSRIEHPISFALDLASVVRALQRLPTDGAPAATNRARPLHDYQASALGAIEHAGHLIDAEAARAVWEEALAAPPHEGGSAVLPAHLSADRRAFVAQVGGARGRAAGRRPAYRSFFELTRSSRSSPHVSPSPPARRTTSTTPSGAGPRQRFRGSLSPRRGSLVTAGCPSLSSRVGEDRVQPLGQVLNLMAEGGNLGGQGLKR
jgi:hypothetical protein